MTYNRRRLRSRRVDRFVRHLLVGQIHPDKVLRCHSSIIPIVRVIIPTPSIASQMFGQRFVVQCNQTIIVRLRLADECLHREKKINMRLKIDKMNVPIFEPRWYRIRPAKHTACLGHSPKSLGVYVPAFRAHRRAP